MHDLKIYLVNIILNSNLDTKKFVVGFQGGTDGFDPRAHGGPDSDGTKYGLGNWNGAATNYDSASYFNAIATVSNPDEIDINSMDFN